MDQDKIILPDFLIADLYKGCLVDLDIFAHTQSASAVENLPGTAEVITGAPGKIKYFGDNQKKIAVLVNQPGSTFLNKADLTFLTNILKACRLNIEDIAVVNAAEQPVTFTAIKEQLSALQLILFDIAPSLIKLPFNIPLFQVQYYADTTIMLAPALAMLNRQDNESRVLKTKLWNGLKQVFGIN